MKSVLATLALALTGLGIAHADVRTDAMNAAAQKAMSPADVLARLKAGNERFVKGESTKTDFMAQVRATATGQFPLAAVLGCVDSRVPPEVVFDQAVGDIFSARVAGNFVNDDILGSLEFATKVAGSKLVVVLGHTSCGAVKGSCDNVQLGHISALVNEIRPSVLAKTPKGETCSSKNHKLVDSIATHNVQRTLAEMRNNSEILRTLEEEGKIKLVGAMYNVATGKVEFIAPQEG